jgi:hypothetical protein
MIIIIFIVIKTLPLDPVFLLSVRSSNSNVVEETETHRLVTFCMVAWGSAHK